MLKRYMVYVYTRKDIRNEKKNNKKTNKTECQSGMRAALRVNSISWVLQPLNASPDDKRNMISSSLISLKEI